MPLRKSVATLAGLVLAAIFVLAPAGSVVAQDDQEEALAYTAWFAANQAQDNAKAVEAAEAYLEKFPNGEYAEFLTKWVVGAKLEVLNKAIGQAIADKDADKLVSVGRQLYEVNPENINVPWTIAQKLYLWELTGSPATYDHAAEAEEFSKITIKQLDEGKAPAVDGFDKNRTLAWLNQALAMVEANDGNTPGAIEYYEKSTSLAPLDPAIAGRNLYALYTIRAGAYNESAQAVRAAHEASGDSAEPTPEFEAATARMDADADALIDVAARFVAFADATNVAAQARSRVYDVLKTVYVARNPEDAEATGLQAVLDSKKP